MVAGAHAAKSQDGSRAALGIALTPANFPRHVAKDIDEMFRLGKEIGSVAVFIYQWSQPDLLDVARIMAERCRKEGLTAVLSLSPTKLDGGRGDLDVPDDVRKRAVKKLSFANPAVHQPFIAASLELAKNNPPYLCLATEINFLAFRNIREYVTFAEVYRRTYQEIKKFAPSTKVFVSFQWDYFRVMAKREPGKIKEHAKLFEVFGDHLDVVGLTSYPADHFKEPGDIPADYYAKVRDYLPRGQPIAFTEIGWPSTGKTDERSQAVFVRRIRELTAAVAPELIAWSLLHDVQVPELGESLGTTGLLNRSGKPKPAFAAFRELR
jgi:hypothetical protein